MAAGRAKLPTVAKPAKAPRLALRNERDLRKEIKSLERTITELDEQKRSLTAQLLKSTNADEALRLHNDLSALTAPLAEAEERWCRLQEDMEGAA